MPLEKKLKITKTGFYLCYTALIVLISLWNLQRNGEILWTIWVIQLAPLLIFLSALYKGYYRTYSWFCFLMLLYFVAAVMSAMRSTSDWYDYLFLILVCLLFVFSMYASRWAQLLQKQLIQKQPAIEEDVN